MKITSSKPQAMSKSHPAAGEKKKAGGGGHPDVFDKAIKGAGKNQSEADLLKQQKALQEHSEKFQLKSNLIAMEHEMMKSIIANFRF